MDSAALAGALTTDPDYTDILCRTAFAFQILERDGDGWRMGPHMDAILGDPDSPFYLGRAATVHLLLGGEDYPDLADRIRRGRVVSYAGPQRRASSTRSPTASARCPGSSSTSCCRASRPSPLALAAGARVLDLGCGAGWAIVELADRFPASRVDGADIEPRSVELAADRIVRTGLADRCAARLLGPEGLTDVAAYDVITMFLVVHEIEPDVKDGVLASAARALTPGGSLVIFDEAYPDTDEAMRTMPSRFTAVAQWYELTWGNRIDTAAVLRDAGLEGRAPADRRDDVQPVHDPRGREALTRAPFQRRPAISDPGWRLPRSRIRCPRATRTAGGGGRAVGRCRSAALTSVHGSIFGLSTRVRGREAPRPS